MTRWPVYDSGNSLFYRSDWIPAGKDLLDLEVSSFAGKEVQLLKSVRNRGAVDLSRLPSEKVLYDLLGRDHRLSAERKERIVQTYQFKKKVLEDFQNGAKVWSYRYRNGVD